MLQHTTHYKLRGLHAEAAESIDLTRVQSLARLDRLYFLTMVAAHERENQGGNSAALLDPARKTIVSMAELQGLLPRRFEARTDQGYGRRLAELFASAGNTATFHGNDTGGD